VSDIGQGFKAEASSRLKKILKEHGDKDWTIIGAAYHDHGKFEEIHLQVFRMK